jgi:hypothetical protein
MTTILIRAALQAFAGALGIESVSKESWTQAICAAAMAAATAYWSAKEKAAIKAIPPAKETRPSDTTLIGLLVLAFIPLLIGCTTYTHTRSIDPRTSVVTEETKLRAPWLTKAAIIGLKSRVSDRTDSKGIHSYSRSIGLDSGTSETDVEGVRAVQALIGSVLVEALKKGSGVP